MNLLTRNLIAVALAAVSCLATAALFLYLELHFGTALYSYSLWEYIPAGAIAAGLVAAAGYSAGSLLLRLRPAPIMLIALIALAGGTVFVMDSVEYGLFRVDPKTVNVTTVLPFLASSLAQSPLQFWPGAGGDAAAAPPAMPGTSQPNPDMPRVAADGDSRVREISGGVQTALSSNSVGPGNSFSGVQQRFRGAQALGAGVMDHAAVLELALGQWIGFALAGLFAYTRLRTLSYCEDCNLFLKRKGAQTRYYDREREIQGSVTEFLNRVKSRRFGQSVEVHAELGSAKRERTSEFSSTVEIGCCKGCQRHRLKFSARRKSGMSWKEIGMLGHTAFCIEPIELARG